MNEIQPIENNETWGSIRAKLNELIASGGSSGDIACAAEASHPIQHILILDDKGELKKIRLVDLLCEMMCMQQLQKFPHHMPIGYSETLDSGYSPEDISTNLFSIAANNGYIIPPKLTGVNGSSDGTDTLTITADIENPDKWDVEEVKVIVVNDDKEESLALDGTSLSGESYGVEIKEGVLTIKANCDSTGYTYLEEYTVKICWYDSELCIDSFDCVLNPGH